VEEVKADCANNKLTVKGKVDPAVLREKVEQKTKKKVDLVSPQPKKEVAAAGGGGGAGEKKSEEKSEKKSEEKSEKKVVEKKPEEKKVEEKKPEEKKAPIEVPTNTVVLKIRLHCDGCIHKIKRIISKINGVDKVVPDSAKDTVTVIGKMDVKKLEPYLKEKLKRSVEIVPEVKKDAEKKVDKKEEKKSDEKQEKPKAEESKAVVANAEPKMEMMKMEYGYGNYSNTYTMPMYDQSYAVHDYAGPSNHYYNQDYPHHNYMMEYSHPPPPVPPPQPIYFHDSQGHQMFSDENPNGCSVM
jgi:copper chaperone CopZ